MNPVISSILSSPFVKSLVVALVGAVAPIILAGFEHPTGGLAQALASNPAYGTAWGVASYLAHNFYSWFQSQYPAPASPAAAAVITNAVTTSTEGKKP